MWYLYALVVIVGSGLVLSDYVFTVFMTKRMERRYRTCYCSVCSVKPVVNSRRHEAIRKRHGLKAGKYNVR